MFIDSHDAFLEAQFEDSVRQRFARLKLEDGMPSGDVVAKAILLDRRHAGVPAERLAELSAQELVDAYAEVTWVLFEARSGGDATLPFGTVATSERAGGLKIGGCHYMLDAGRPGLHEMEGMRRDAHGPNLELLQALIRKKTRRLACRRLGVPHAASIFDNMPRELLQFDPCEDAGGVVLQREAYGSGAERFCAATYWQLDAFADAIVVDMRKFWKSRRQIAARAAVVRKAAEAEIRNAELGAPLCLRQIAVDLSMQDLEPAPSLYVEFHGLDEALRPGVILDFAPGNHEEWRANVSFRQKYRSEDAAQLRALGADGWIEPTAAAMAAMTPGGAAAALAPLVTGQEAYVAIPTAQGTMHATLFWREGTIKVEIDVPGVFSWFHNTVELKKAGLPETIVNILPGRPMSDVFSQPLASAGTITDASPLNDGGMRLRVEEPQEQALRVELATGRIW